MYIKNVVLVLHHILHHSNAVKMKYTSLFYPSIFLISALLFLPTLSNAQCYFDFYGTWKTLGGQFIKMTEHNPDKGTFEQTFIGNQDTSYKGYHYYENRILSIYHDGYRYDEKTNTGEAFQKLFACQVLNVDHQSMEIRPISEDMKTFFGDQDIRFFKEEYIPFDSFAVDSIHYKQFGSPYQLSINSTGQLRLKEQHQAEGSERYFTAQLDEAQVKTLQKVVLQSRLTYASKCEFNRHCVDCASHAVHLFYNGRDMRYYSSRNGLESAGVLILHLSKMIEGTDWKRCQGREGLWD